MALKLKEKLAQNLLSVKVWFALAGLGLLLGRRLEPEQFVKLTLGLIAARELSDLRNTYFNKENKGD